MAVKIAEQMMNVLGSDSVPSPFLDVVCEEGFVGVRFRFLGQANEVLFQVFDELVVKLFAEKMGCDGKTCQWSWMAREGRNNEPPLWLACMAGPPNPTAF